MNWTSEKPTKPGWYWHYTHNDRGMEFVTIFLVYDLENGGPLVCGHEDLVDVAQHGGKWAGPLEAPT